ncbi:MAG: pentapeptide repeat-containing protein [Bifidobacteriaceae bacterium]|jgi:hypothetical protein|nr:pentapeptide repeat-containing protein [Bifidobacteriaceae bacterium]
MAHDVFISHSSADKATADAACHALEQAGTRCWIAPRDETAGIRYFSQISTAIEACQLMVLVFSAKANMSQDVINEVGLAFNSGKPVLPFRIENVLPQLDLSYLLQGVHWLDAHPDPDGFANLVDHVQRHLRAEAQTARPVTQPPPLGLPAERSGVDPAEVVPLVGPSPRSVDDAVPPVPATQSSPSSAGPGKPHLATAPQTGVIKAGGRYAGQIFSGLVMTGVNAKGCNFTRAVFRGTDLRGARLESAILTSANLEGALLDGARLYDSRIDFANLQDASCVQANFEYARLTRSDLRRADLTGARFVLLDGHEAVFEDAIACGADFTKSLLNDAEFGSANLRGANFTEAVLDGCSLVGADLTGAHGLSLERLRAAIIDDSTVLDRVWRDRLGTL